MKLKEECGVFGIISNQLKACGSIVYTGLISQQHRGQESAGIATFKNSSVIGHKGKGLVSSVFSPDVVENFNKTDIAIGHVRYSASSNNSLLNAQPIITNHSKANFALAHNGNLTNAKQLKSKLQDKYGVVFNTGNDAEVINMLIINEMIKGNDFISALKKVISVIEGAYSLVIMTKDILIAVRDRIGFRPLCIGSTDNSVVVASESCALDSVGAEFLKDVSPGEIIVIDKTLRIESYYDEIKAPKGICSFEYIYFSRQDSVIDGRSVYKMRKAMGKYLALQKPVEADMVCGVPDSGLEGAKGYAEQSKIPYGSAFVVNRYIGRSFICPTKNSRESAVRLKLNPLRAAIKGKKIVLVDDSIVRGTTCVNIVNELRNAGATEVHMRITAPMFKYACYFGTDIKNPQELIANKMSLEQMTAYMGADSLDFLSVDNLLKISNEEDPGFCVGCFSGTYPMEVK